MFGVARKSTSRVDDKLAIVRNASAKEILVINETKKTIVGHCQTEEEAIALLLGYSRHDVFIEHKQRSGKLVIGR